MKEKNSNKMEPIKGIASHIKIIREKLDVGGRDWTKIEKEAIAKAYFEITKVSTGKGRVLDVNCESCVVSAVNIIKNYLEAIGEPVKAKLPKAATKAPTIVTPVDDKKDDDNKGIAGDTSDAGEEDTGDTSDAGEEEMIFAPSNKQWRKNLETVAEAAKELEYTFTDKATKKAQRIKALEDHMKMLNA
jgi:hypothetical protein